jgi:hypothetical protein
MSDARQAVQAAREAGAVDHAGAALAKAERRLAKAEVALGTNQYDEARDLALEAKDRAGKARELAVATRKAEIALAEAGRLGVDGGEARDLLALSRARAREGDPVEAAKLAERANREAEEALNRHYLEAARGIVAAAAPRRRSLAPSLGARFDEAQAAIENQEGRRAYELARGLPARGGGSGSPTQATKGSPGR